MRKIKFILLIFLIIFQLSLSGCFDSVSNYRNKILGTWYSYEYPKFINYSVIPIEYTWVFFNNNSMKSTAFFQNDTINQTLTLWYKYNITQDNICLHLIYNKTSDEIKEICFNYEFIDNDQILTIFMNENILASFRRIN